MWCLCNSRLRKGCTGGNIDDSDCGGASSSSLTNHTTHSNSSKSAQVWRSRPATAQPARPPRGNYCDCYYPSPEFSILYFPLRCAFWLPVAISPKVKESLSEKSTKIGPAAQRIHANFPTWASPTYLAQSKCCRTPFPLFTCSTPFVFVNLYSLFSCLFHSPIIDPTICCTIIYYTLHM